jgi:putative ABC transport system permease protein
MLTRHGAPAHLKAQRITPELLPLLGVMPQAGRAFVAEEFQPGSDQVALISDRLWRTRFGANPQIIGQEVTLDDRPYTVVGVTPPRFDFFPHADMLTPLAFTAEDLRQEGYYGLGIIARLKPGTALELAQQEVAGIARGFPEERDIRLQPLRELLVKDFRLTLLALWGVAGFVLLIACANVANLMLARAANRQKELAIRAAIAGPALRLPRREGVVGGEPGDTPATERVGGDGYYPAPRRSSDQRLGDGLQPGTHVADGPALWIGARAAIFPA